MRWAVALAVVAGLLAVPAASAKMLTMVVAVGADDVSVELQGFDWSALRTTPVTLEPEGGYALVYPLMERGVPAQPGRYYPAAQIACYSWNRAVPGERWRVAETLAARLPGVRLFQGTPTILASLVVSGRRVTLASNGAVAIELAFARRECARSVKKRSKQCIEIRAVWTGPNASLRPKRFWACPNGVWVANKLYPARSLPGIYS